MNSLSKIQKWIKMDESNVAFLMRYFARLPTALQIVIMQRHRRILFQKKEEFKNNEVEIQIASWISLVLAIKSLYVEEKRLTKKKFDDLNDDEIEQLHYIKIEKFKKKNSFRKISKRKKLMNYWAVVKTLRSDGFSFRSIAEYLKKEYKFYVSYSLIFNVWKEVEES